MILSLEDNWQLLQDKKVIILYGAETYGKACQQILKRTGIDITCFAVSDGQIVGSLVNEKEVKMLSSINYEPMDTIFILTLNEKYWAEIERKLEKKGYDRILGFSAVFVQRYIEDFLQKIMSNKTRAKSGVADLSILKIYDPLITPFRKEFMFEAGNLILPYLGESIFISEGLYEIENVVVDVNDVVIDCGAHIGIFSAFAAQKGGEVFAFEPAPEVRAFLQQNASLYLGKIHVEQYALSNENGEGTMFITDSSDCNTLLKDYVNELDQITVPTITLDQFVKERNLPRVDFIKADIEGAERLMLAGAQETLRRFAPKLAICTYHLPDDKEVLEGLIKQANPDYIVTHRWKKLYAYVPEEKRQQLLQANAVWQKEVQQ